MPKVVAEYKAQARDRIVAAARVVFRREGFRKATMDDIAREIGVSKGALYLYFRTKNDLLAEIQRRFRNEVLQRWEGLLEKGDVADGIASSLDAVFSREVDPEVWHELGAASGADPSLRRLLEADEREDQRLMRRFVRRLQERGRIPKSKDPSALAEVILVLLHGTVSELVIRGPDADSRKRLARSLRLVLGT
ncbi:MAG: TetR/AcrR family transcriptional regulator [Thermoplasmata archaeon]